MRRTRKIWLATGVALASSALFAVPASASTAYQSCPGAGVCFWHDQDYAGTRFVLFNSDPHLGDNSDEAHSVFNTAPVAVRLHVDQDYGGAYICIPPAGRNPDLGPFGDEVTSVLYTQGTVCT